MDWRRHFLRGWKFSAALLVVLAAIATIWPFQLQNFLSPSVAADFLFEGQNLDGVDMRVTNSGREPITVSVGNLTISGNDGYAIGHLTTDKMFFHNRSFLVGPASSQIVRYYLTGYEGWVFASSANTCKLSFKYTADNIRYHNFDKVIDCGDVQDLSLMWGAWTNSENKPSDYK